MANTRTVLCEDYRGLPVVSSVRIRRAALCACKVRTRSRPKIDSGTVFDVFCASTAVVSITPRERSIVSCVLCLCACTLTCGCAMRSQLQWLQPLWVSSVSQVLSMWTGTHIRWRVY